MASSNRLILTLLYTPLRLYYPLSLSRYFRLEAVTGNLSEALTTLPIMSTQRL